ncbi:hypothetical protein C1646_665039 [Rhizophagus diaphanus]|nr:hypothetical protein C1646_665039 [Rhizophagus diaphanus] [Rhizophagus sp. MUCL 43196]
MSVKWMSAKWDSLNWFQKNGMSMKWQVGWNKETALVDPVDPKQYETFMTYQKKHYSQRTKVLKLLASHLSPPGWKLLREPFISPTDVSPTHFFHPVMVTCTCMTVGETSVGEMTQTHYYYPDLRNDQNSVSSLEVSFDIRIKSEYRIVNSRQCIDQHCVGVYVENAMCYSTQKMLGNKTLCK